MIHLDPWLDPVRGVRIQVLEWYSFFPIHDQFIEQPRSIRMIWNYFRRVGALAVWQKIRSRLNEKSRDCKVAAIGIGVVLDASGNILFKSGDSVFFFACNHPVSPSRICVDSSFVMQLLGEDANASFGKQSFDLPEELNPYVGWSMFSGVNIDTERVRQGLQKISERIKGIGAKRGEITVDDSEITEYTSLPVHLDSRPTAVLFGLGNYAKVQIIPIIKKNLNLRRIHDVDPDQFLHVRASSFALDVSPLPRKNDKYDAWFIAGYHHTHAGLAIDALNAGAYAVIEKPIATTWEQYNDLEKVIQTNSTSRFFACFHKRYSELHGLALSDLSVNIGQPIDMHCIVYEIPLPRLHWYNWPNSGSRLISNGCHWLDYFMFVNDYVSVSDCGVWKARGSDIAVFVRLENAAYFVMSLTDTGSQRLGVRDTIELRSGGVTVCMIDGSIYESENRSKIFRKKKINPIHAYRRMYQLISEKIVAGSPGDSLESLRSTKLTLRLEDELVTFG